MGSSCSAQTSVSNGIEPPPQHSHVTFVNHDDTAASNGPVVDVSFTVGGDDDDDDVPSAAEAAAMKKATLLDRSNTIPSSCEECIGGQDKDTALLIGVGNSGGVGTSSQSETTSASGHGGHAVVTSITAHIGDSKHSSSSLQTSIPPTSFLSNSASVHTFLAIPLVEAPPPQPQQQQQQAERQFQSAV